MTPMRFAGWLDAGGPRRWTAALSRWGARADDDRPTSPNRDDEDEFSGIVRRRPLVLLRDSDAGAEVAWVDPNIVVLSGEELADLDERGSARSISGIIVDLTPGIVRRSGSFRRCVERRLFERVPTVALVASARGAREAARLGVFATVWCEGERSEALTRASTLCTRMAREEREDAQVAYASLLASHRELGATHQLLRARADEDEGRGAMLVHDLRSPLGVVHGAISELLLDLGEGPDRELVTLAADATRQLEALIDRLEQLYAGAGEPSHPTRVDVAALAEGVADGLRHAPAARGKMLRVRHDGPAHIVADRQDLVRVLSNLAGNALRHARSDVEIIVGACERELSIEVKDDGPGLPSAMREGLFVRARRSPGAGRMGLGLAIVQRAVMRHGGRVEPHDRREREGVSGACFVVRLPIDAPSTNTHDGR